MATLDLPLYQDRKLNVAISITVVSVKMLLKIKNVMAHFKAPRRTLLRWPFTKEI